MSHIQIKTEIHGDLIVQEVTGPERDWRTMARERISFEVMNTKDAQTREALVKMGWTPPMDDVREGKILIDGIWNSVSTVFMDGDTSNLPQIDDQVIDALSSRDRFALAQGAVVNAKAPDGSSRLFRLP